MRTFLVFAVVASAAVAVAQDCIKPRPPLAAVKANFVGTKFTNPDGGARPCFGYATTAAGGEEPKLYQMANADCDRLKRLGDWAVQQDNGWGDGGLP